MTRATARSVTESLRALSRVKGSPKCDLDHQKVQGMSVRLIFTLHAALSKPLISTDACQEGTFIA